MGLFCFSLCLFGQKTIDKKESRRTCGSAADSFSVRGFFVGEFSFFSVFIRSKNDRQKRKHENLRLRRRFPFLFADFLWGNFCFSLCLFGQKMIDKKESTRTCGSAADSLFCSRIFCGLIFVFILDPFSKNEKESDCTCTSATHFCSRIFVD